MKKSYMKLLTTLIVVVCAVLAFQNCSKKNNSKENDPVTSFSGPSAQDLVAVMESAGIQDPVAVNSLQAPEKITLTAEDMNCSRILNTNSQQCVFNIKKSDGTIKTVKTTSASTQNIIDFLYASGAKLTCVSNCNDLEGYLVKSVICFKDNLFPDQTNCRFRKK